MRRKLFLTILIPFLFGCSNEVITKSETVEDRNVFPTHIATFEVEGMMCQKGCGAAIRKGLYETGGVSEVEVSFNEENPVNEIIVYFDIKKTSTEKMILVIKELADKRYSAKLKKVTESTISSHNVNSDEKYLNQKIKNITTREVSTRSFSLPNLTKLLNGLIN